MGSKKKPIFAVSANVLAALGLLIGIWFIQVGLGYGDQTQVPGDGIAGFMLMAFGLSLSLLCILIGLVRRERNFRLYIFPSLSIIGFLLWISWLYKYF